MPRLSRLYPRRLADQDRDIREFWRLSIAESHAAAGRRGVVIAVIRLFVDLAGTWVDEWHHRPPRDGDGWMARWWQDVRYSCFSLLGRPGLALASVLSLAIGLGGALAIYAAAQAVLFRPLPFAQSDRLVSVDTMVQREALEPRALSVPDYLDFRAQATRHIELTAAWSAVASTLRAGGPSYRVNGEMVSGRYFELLGVTPLIGAGLPDRDVTDAAPAIVLSESVWERLFDRDPSVVGRVLMADDVPFTVVGVVPAGTRGLSDDAEFWMPFAMHNSLVSEATWNSRGSRWHNAAARLREGSTVEAAEIEAKGIADRLQQEYSASNEGYTIRLRAMRDVYFGEVRSQVILLLIAAGVVLLMTCVNVANLLVARLSSRQFEFSVRTALGATRSRLISLAATDGLVLAVCGATLGAPLTFWFVRVLRQLSPVSLPSFSEPTVSWGVAGAGCALTLSAAAVVALASAMSVGSPAALTEAPRGSSDTTRHVRLRRLLTVVQVAGAVALLTTAALLGLSFDNLTRVETGYTVPNRIAARFEIPSATYTPERLQVVKLSVMRELAQVPGVQDLAMSTDTMLGGGGSASFYTVDVAAPTEAAREGRTYVHAVTDNFFAVAGIPLLEGATVPAFDGTLLEPAQVDLPVLVSASLARRFWPTSSAVGQRMKFGRSATDRPWMRIVGVVGDTKYRGLPDNPTADPDVYLPFASRASSVTSLLVNTDVDPASLLTSLERALRQVAPQMPLYASYVLEERVREATAPQRFLSQLSSTFGLVALLLAIVGIYGVVAYQVTLARRAIGIRLALGATPRRIFFTVIGDMTRLLVLGLSTGLVLVWLVATGLRGQLYGVSPANGAVLSGVLAVVSLVALLSAWFPARRAMHVDPVSVLRGDA